jgi:hypothetical protein
MKAVTGPYPNHYANISLQLGFEFNRALPDTGKKASLVLNKHLNLTNQLDCLTSKELAMFA